MANLSADPKVYECNSRKITMGLNLKDSIATYTVKIFKNLDVHMNSLLQKLRLLVNLTFCCYDTLHGLLLACLQTCIHN